LLQDVGLEQSSGGGVSLFTVDRNSDCACADTHDLPCMARELEQEVEELEYQAVR
jgi:hypothetical protein